jgi:hypothetical protein
LFDLIEEIYTFFTGSINRYHIFRTQIDSSTSVVTVKNLSITRWPANYESVNAIYRSMPEIIKTFNLIISHIDEKKLIDTNNKVTPEDKKAKQQVYTLMLDSLTKTHFSYIQSINLQKSSSIIRIYFVVTLLKTSNTTNSKSYRAPTKEIS